jgi:hypothetical protein
MSKANHGIGSNRSPCRNVHPNQRTITLLHSRILPPTQQHIQAAVQTSSRVPPGHAVVRAVYRLLKTDHGLSWQVQPTIDAQNVALH